MAIKTKKITDLGILSIGDEALMGSDFYIIACRSGITGKISTSEMVGELKEIILKNVSAGSSGGNYGEFYAHMNNDMIHFTVDEKNRLSSYDKHIENTGIHVTQDEKDKWNALKHGITDTDLNGHADEKATGSKLGHVTLSDSITLNSSAEGGIAATPKAVNDAYNKAITQVNTNIASKQDKITGAATEIVSKNLTTNRALISNSSGKVAVSPITSTELGYLDGVTSKIQTQINSKLSCTYWKSGKSWYRKYSDGFIEQGGYCNAAPGGTTVNLHTAFSNTNYTILLTPQFDELGWAGVVKPSGKTKTSFLMYFYSWATIPAYWYACGY